MNSWLNSTIELLKIRNESQFLDFFTSAIVKNLKLKQAFLLSLCQEGRQLSYQNSGEIFTWSTFDFTVPFTHVIQEKTPKLLTSIDLVYWQGNPQFDRLISNVGMNDGCLIYPLLHRIENKVPLLVLIGEVEKLNPENLDKDFLAFLDAFCSQYFLLQEIKYIKNEKNELSEVITATEVSKSQGQKIAKISSHLIGKSSVMDELKEKIVQASESNLSVMIQGDTGTGKEIVANAIHSISEESNGNFIAINCSAIPENLLESELFGYEKGAFSGASAAHVGLIKQADGGTLFLDEIGDMPIHLQCKLLRVLESKCFRPLGGKSELSSNFRLISATHINLKDKVRSQEFRQDLYYRLMQFPLYVPKLSERRSDIEILSMFFVDKFNADNHRSVGYLNKKSIDYLMNLDFHGNVRELKSLIELSCAQVKDDHSITLENITKSSTVINVFSENSERTDELFCIDGISDLKKGLEEFESKIIRSRVDRFCGNKSKAARSLSIPVRTLNYKYKKIEGVQS